MTPRRRVLTQEVAHRLAAFSICRSSSHLVLSAEQTYADAADLTRARSNAAVLTDRDDPGLGVGLGGLGIRARPARRRPLVPWRPLCHSAESTIAPARCATYRRSVPRGAVPLVTNQTGAPGPPARGPRPSRAEVQLAERRSLLSDRNGL